MYVLYKYKAMLKNEHLKEAFIDPNYACISLNEKTEVLNMRILIDIDKIKIHCTTFIILIESTGLFD